MTVVDAGVVVAALIEQGELGESAWGVLAGHCAAPELLDLEVGAVLRRLTLGGLLTERRARAAIHDLHDLPIQRAPHQPLLARCWTLRDSVTFYDAAYVALAEVLSTPLATTDARLSRAPGPRCTFTLLT